MPSRTDDGRTIIHVECDPDLKRNVRIAAAAEEKSISQYVRDTLRASAEGDVPNA